MMATQLDVHVRTSEVGEDLRPPTEEKESEDGSDAPLSDEGEGINGDDGAEDGDQEEDDGDGNANAGWAEAMAKILGKKTQSKVGILEKNKELDKAKEKEREKQLERKTQMDKKRAWEMMCREKPDLVKDRETERTLQRIATRGVVQLFNAVRKHQKKIDTQVKEVGGSERKKAKILSTVSKKDFIDVLRSTEGGPIKTEKTATQMAGAEEKPAWSVLRDDYMMGATMKDWDKHSDGEEADAAESD